jgi:hypothetical protein
MHIVSSKFRMNEVKKSRINDWWYSAKIKILSENKVAITENLFIAANPFIIGSSIDIERIKVYNIYKWNENKYGMIII